MDITPAQQWAQGCCQGADTVLVGHSMGAATVLMEAGAVHHWPRHDELGGASRQTRTEPYRDMPSGCKWLTVIDGATHINLASNGMARKTEALTTQVIGDFLDGAQRGACSIPKAHPAMAMASK